MKIYNYVLFLLLVVLFFCFFFKEMLFLILDLVIFCLFILLLIWLFELFVLSGNVFCVVFGFLDFLKGLC